MRQVNAELEHLALIVLSKSAREIHLIANYVACFRGAIYMLEDDPEDLWASKQIIFWERVLRSFLITKDIRESKRLIEEAQTKES